MCCLQNKSIARTMIWLATEILFNFVGIDDLADYSEFVFENNKYETFMIELLESSRQITKYQ